MTEPEAVHYEVEASPTGKRPWLMVQATACLIKAQRIAIEALGKPWVTHTRIRRVVAAKSVEVERQA